MAFPSPLSPGRMSAGLGGRAHCRGSDYIKIVYDDSTEYGSEKPRPTLSKELMKAVVAAAHKRGKLVVTHIGSLQQALDAIDAARTAWRISSSGRHPPRSSPPWRHRTTFSWSPRSPF